MQKILLDTDIGTDIDDAVCLAYLLAHPECDLQGITTVTGEPHRRAVLAGAVCRSMGRQVPIYPGAADPIIVEQQQKRAEQADFLEDSAPFADFPSGEAIEFMRRTIRAHPGEITLLTIGPLTNVGLLFSVDPEVPSMLKGLVSMCGLFHGPVPHFGTREWNAFGDPHATAVVYRSAVSHHRSIGVDVTHRVTMDATTFRKTFRNVPFDLINRIGAEWIDRWDGVTFHDPLAAATIFEPSLCRYERGRVSVELHREESLGTTHWAPAPDGPHEIAVSVDSERFFDHFSGVVNRA